MKGPAGRPRMVLCVGEPLIALVPTGGADLAAADRLDVMTGGAELNVAVHLARRGQPVRFGCRVGDDPWGRKLRAVLVGEGVDASALGAHPSLPTGIYVKDVSDGRSVMHYYRQGSAASALENLPAGAFEAVDHVHLTGITPALSASCQRVVADVAAPGRHYAVSFDVNFRPALWPAAEAAPVLCHLAELADVVFVGLDEARALWGCRDAGAVRSLLEDVPELVVKDGPDAAVSFTNGGTVAARPGRLPVVDAVGAGDAFAAGYLVARWQGASAAEALGSGHELAAAVLGSYGDHGAAAPPAAGIGR